MGRNYIEMMDEKVERLTKERDEAERRLEETERRWEEMQARYDALVLNISQFLGREPVEGEDERVAQLHKLIQGKC